MDWNWSRSGGLHGWLKLDGEAELLEASDQSAGFDLDGASIEVTGPEVVVFSAVLEDVVDGREDRCGDGTDGLLGSTAMTQALELRFGA